MEKQVVGWAVKWTDQTKVQEFQKSPTGLNCDHVGCREHNCVQTPDPPRVLHVGEALYGLYEKRARQSVARLPKDVTGDRTMILFRRI